MARIDIPAFLGMRPAIAPRLLGAGMATYAKNVKLRDGEMEPFSNPRQFTDATMRFENGLSSVGATKSLHLWDVEDKKELLLFPDYTSIVTGNIAEDEYRRLFVADAAGNREPMVYIRSSEEGLLFARLTMVREELDAPVAERVSQEAVIDNDTRRWTRFYQTWVDAYGYESPLSPASNEVEYNDGDEIRINAGNLPQLAMKRRIYKSLSSLDADEPEIQFIWEQERDPDTAFPQFEFTKEDQDAGEIAPDGDPTPSDLRDIVFVNNNFYAGFTKGEPRTVRFSNAAYVLTWPLEYGRSVFDDIVRLAVAENTVFVLTKGFPWLLTGSEADGMIPTKVPSVYPCVSWNSVCVAENVCFYASNEGVVMLTPTAGAAATLLTEKIFSREQWRKLKPESCHIVSVDGYLLLFFMDVGKSYVIDIKSENVTVVEIDLTVVCSTLVTEKNELIYVRRG